MQCLLFFCKPGHDVSDHQNQPGKNFTEIPACGPAEGDPVPVIIGHLDPECQFAHRTLHFRGFHNSILKPCNY